MGASEMRTLGLTLVGLGLAVIAAAQVLLTLWLKKFKK